MTMVFQRIETPGIAQISYLVGDDGSGTAAVIDPRPNVDVYLRLAHQYETAITHVFETHIHADFMSGVRELADRLGTAQLCVSGEDRAEYGFDVMRIADGDAFEFGSVILTARHTPGHTPEHLAYEIAQTSPGAYLPGTRSSSARQVVPTFWARNAPRNLSPCCTARCASITANSKTA